MANSIDDLLSKSSQEQKDKFQSLVADATKDTKASLQLKEAAQETPATGLRETPPPQAVESAQKTTNAYASSDINNRSPQQEQESKNAIDRALDNKAKAATAEQGQNLTKQGVSVAKDVDIDR